MTEDPGHAELLAAVDELAAAMKAKLNVRKSKHQARLETIDAASLLDWLDQEANELDLANQAAAEGEGSLDAVRDEAADVANLAMMVWVRQCRLVRAAQR